MNRGNCRVLATGPLHGTWFRAIQLAHLPTSLATVHTRTIPSRFSAANVAHPGFEILYLAETHFIALFEVQALLGSPMPPSFIVPNPAQPWTIINVDVSLSHVADLCRVRQRRLIETSVQELTGDWRSYALRNPVPAIAPFFTKVPTQRLGRALHSLRRIEGFTTYSAKVPTGKNLVIFPKKLLPGSTVKFTYTDSAGKTETHQIP